MNRKILLIVFTIISIIIIILFFQFLFAKDKTIGSISYNINSKGDYRVYIKENDNYVPYIVLENNYNNQSTLLVRENAIGGTASYYDYNGSIYKENIYNEYMLMNQYSNYEQTDVDKFLTTEFINYFDSEFISLVENTKINVIDSIDNSNYQIKRKFFLLSIGELGLDNVYDKNDNKELKYFKENSLITRNDLNKECNWWTRTYGWESYIAIGASGLPINPNGTEAKYAIRPAFTISNETKVKKIYINNLDKEVYTLEY